MCDPDRRRALVIGNGGHEVAAITENLASAGVLLYADRLVREGFEIGLILVAPAAETEAKSMWCFGKVLRVEKGIEGRKVWPGYRIPAF